MNLAAAFADTSFYIAALDPADPGHANAIAASKVNRRIVTTKFIILELGNALSRAEDHQDLLALVEVIRANPRVKVIPLDSTLLNRGLRRLGDRPDKDWSLTDCISFLVMEDEGVTSALTTDKHFEQAGFTALLR